MELEYSTKLAAAQGNQAASGRVKEMETENLKAEIEKLKRLQEKTLADAMVQDSNNKKLISSLESEIVKMKQDLAGSKDSIKTIEGLKRREQDLMRELEALRQVSRPSSNTQQVDRLQKELMDANAISQQQALTIAQLRSELASGKHSGSAGGAGPSNPQSQKEMSDLRAELQKANSLIAELKQNGGGHSGSGSNTQAVDKMSKELGDLKTENMKLWGIVCVQVAQSQLSSQVTLLTKKNEELEQKMKGLSAGGDSAAKALEEEIKRLKEQLELEEKKKQSLIVRFNEKIAERDEDIKQLQAASSGRPAPGTSAGDPALIKKNAALES